MTGPNLKNLEDFADNLKPGRKCNTAGLLCYDQSQEGTLGRGCLGRALVTRASGLGGQRLSPPYSHLPRGVPRVQIGQSIYPLRSPNSEDFHFLPFTKPNIPKPNTWLSPPRKETRSK